MIVVKRFTADWCQPCKMLAPVMESIKPQVPNAVFEVINIDEQKEIAHQYGIRSIPTVIIEKDGTEVTRFMGMRPAHQILEHINESM